DCGPLGLVRSPGRLDSGSWEFREKGRGGWEFRGKAKRGSHVQYPRRADRQVESAAWTARGGLVRDERWRSAPHRRCQGRKNSARQSIRALLFISEGVTYFWIFVDHPAIPTSSLLKHAERKPCAIPQPHFHVDWRVFKER